MENSFRVRVDKAFGSLASSSATTASPSTNLSSLWSLTDDEIERHEWNRRDANSPEPELQPDSFLFKKGFLSSNRENSDSDYPLELEKDLDDLDDVDDDEESRDSSRASSKPDDYNDEEWEIKNSIGLDCTLDFEEEEDQYDKVAVGEEKSGDRLYMKVINYGMNVDCSNNELPNSRMDVARDPRANHFAAKLRLKEDAEAAKKMDSLRVSEQNSPATVDGKVKVPEDGNLKSILKRSDSKSKEDQLDSKVQKRVRFDPECKDGSDKEDDDDVDMGTNSEDKSLVYPLPPDYPSGIPDYMRNPSKYTRYTFDSSSEVDEQSNRQAFADLMKMLKKKSDSTESQPDGALSELPKSLTFIPKRKVGDADTLVSRFQPKQTQEDNVMKEPLPPKGTPISIAAADAEDSEPSAMEEDEPESAVDKRNNSQRAGRKYRTRARLETEDSI